MVHWIVECEAGCGTEKFHANDIQEAITQANENYSHDRVPHGNNIIWLIKEEGTREEWKFTPDGEALEHWI